MTRKAQSEIEDLCIRTIRVLSAEAIEEARSGHPGAPLGMADVAFVLWTRFLRFDPKAPDWLDRDRFILSAGHASMLLYSLLHLSGYDLPIEEIKRFRQLGSKTPGHPEYGRTVGVEVTTGPLGQGFAHGVGIALASHMLRARFPKLFSFRVFALCSDGDLMEGISSEAASFAGHLGLSAMVYVYDDNRITIEGSTRLAFSENVKKKFEALGWAVFEADGYDHEAVTQALAEAVANEEKPSLVITHTEIAKGAPTLHGQAKTHGAPLGQDEVRAMKEALGWDKDSEFFVPAQVYDYFASIAERNRKERLEWERRFEDFKASDPDGFRLLDAMVSRKVPDDLFERLLASAIEAKGKATRVISGHVIQAASKALPNLVGGSADLAPSNQTEIRGAPHCVPDALTKRFLGVNLHFGIREHAMAAIVNGLNLQGAFRAFGGTFLVFADYMKPALRLSALMEVPSIFVFTHDSIFVGEDGPTHQPIEQLWMLRGIPGMVVFRPCDAFETAGAWAYALRNNRHPVSIVLSRQDVPEVNDILPRSADDVFRGGYVAWRSGRKELCAVIATGSEVFVAVEAARLLEQEGIGCRVISMPSVELFLAQPKPYKEGVLPKRLPCAVVEASSPLGWFRLVGKDGLVVGIERFGLSAPAEVLREEFGFTPEKVASKVRSWLQEQGLF